QHPVTISKPFYIGVTEVTRPQYEQVAGGKAAGVAFPANSVTWDEAVAFCEKLAALPAEKKAGRRYRLPTEAEWEYACRAGTTTPYSFGAAATHRECALSRQRAVGSYPSNAWGLYDMHGNVWEWCSDWWAGGYYERSPPRDPPGPAE